MFDENAQAPANLISKHNAPLSYDKAKKLAISNQPIVADIPLNNVELGRNSTVKINGSIMPLTDKAHSQFLKNVLDVHPTFVKRYKELTDEKTELQMLGTLQKALAAKQNGHAKVFANPRTQSIIGFNTPSFNYMTNEAMLRVFERVMNEHPELQLRDMYVRPDGSLTLNVRSTRMHSFGKNRFNGEPEDFNGGLSFRNVIDNGTSVGHNSLRLVCENGMTRMEEFSKFAISADPKTLDKFFREVTKIGNQGFMTDTFIRNMERAMAVDASVSELEDACRVVKKFSTVEDEEIDAFMPIKDVTKFLSRKGVEYAALKNGQKRNCPTGIPLWTVVNELTHFGSHDRGFGADYARIQMHAGRILDRKAYDGENFVNFN